MRLCDWRISSSQETFSYGGDEVELSVWNTEQAFTPSADQLSVTEMKKRKRGDTLFPGEVWRAKNVRCILVVVILTDVFTHGGFRFQVPNDNLGLRQPVHITSLTYLSPSSPTGHHLLTGTHLGDVRRYDIRAARRPVADWTGIGKIGGVKKVEKGFAEQYVMPTICHEVHRLCSF